MPVHLGSMSESIKTVIARNPAMQPGDVYVLNDPYHGGTHLPDVTVVTPVYLERADAQPQLLRGQPRPPCRHRRQHAGLDAALQPRPSTKKACCSTTSCWCATVRLREAELRRSCVGPLPGAQPDQTIADLRAQIAANEKGVQELARWWRSSAAPRWRPTCSMCRTTPRKVGAPRHHGAEGRRLQLPLDNGAQIASRSRSMPQRARPPSTSPAPARSCPTTSTPPRR
jgi:5-oxoprolinase (ATP-hydrolysing)